MGQRHQVYVRLPNKKVIGIHHQWLYGMSAVNALARLITFGTKSGDHYNPLLSGSDQIGVLSSLYQCDWTSGYYHRVHDITDESSCKDPREGDNNDGITIIDLSGQKTKYCFMSVHHLEGNEEACESIKPLRPLSALQYYEAYYPQHLQHEINENEQALVEGAIKLINGTSYVQLLTLAEVKKIFPAMYKKNDK